MVHEAHELCASDTSIGEYHFTEHEQCPFSTTSSRYQDWGLFEILTLQSGPSAYTHKFLLHVASYMQRESTSYTTTKLSGYPTSRTKRSNHEHTSWARSGSKKPWKSTLRSNRSRHGLSKFPVTASNESTTIAPKTLVGLSFGCIPPTHGRRRFAVR